MSKIETLPPFTAMFITLGIVFLLAILFAQNYNYTIRIEPFNYVTKYPYRDYIFPLALLSITCFVVSIHIYQYEKRKNISDIK